MLRKIAKCWLDGLRRAYMRSMPPLRCSEKANVQERRPRVLVIGVYLADRRNTAAVMARELAASCRFAVSQRWAVIGRSSDDRLLASLTSEQSSERVPRGILLNRLLSVEELDDYEYVIVCDDDVVVRRGWLDFFLELQARHDIALAQPARTRNSWVDHPITRQVPGSECRFTRFVEIGPVVSIHRCLFRHLLPFDVTSPMGWGLDLVWPVTVAELGLNMGIIDAAPVDHSMRQSRTGYSTKTAHDEMNILLSTRPHLAREQAMVTLRTVRAEKR